jgi:hypothetical protein
VAANARKNLVKPLLSLLLSLALAGCGTVSHGDDVDADLTPDADRTPDAEPPPDVSPPDASPPDAMPLDCDNLPPGPFTPVQVGSAVASEDLAFDAAGNLVGADDFTIYKTMRFGPPQVFVANVQFRAGMRFLPNGHLVFANDSEGTLVRVDPEGVRYTMVTGLSYPNGLTVDDEGFVYLTEHDAGQVRRIDPMTGDNTILVTGMTNPNGLTFNATYDLLYIGCFSGEGTIYTMTIDEDGSPGPLTAWATGVGSGMLDGMGVDACGNVYVCDYTYEGNSKLYRLSPDGLERELLVDSAMGETRYLPNMEWGSGIGGIGGWSPTSLYLPDGWNHWVYEIPLGVPSKPRVYP